MPQIRGTTRTLANIGAILALQPPNFDLSHHGHFTLRAPLDLAELSLPTRPERNRALTKMTLAGYATLSAILHHHHHHTLARHL